MKKKKKKVTNKKIEYGFPKLHNSGFPIHGVSLGHNQRLTSKEVVR